MNDSDFGYAADTGEPLIYDSVVLRWRDISGTFVDTTVNPVRALAVGEVAVSRQVLADAVNLLTLNGEGRTHLVVVLRATLDIAGGENGGDR